MAKLECRRTGKAGEDLGDVRGAGHGVGGLDGAAAGGNDSARDEDQRLRDLDSAQLAHSAYDQLLELVDMTPEQLAFALREDDFLWVKLGGLKPKCEPLRYRPPDEAARRRAAEIRRVVEEEFGEEIRSPAEPRFDFVRQLSRPLASSSRTALGAGLRTRRNSQPQVL